jgi:hypothetical protein
VPSDLTSGTVEVIGRFDTGPLGGVLEARRTLPVEAKRK